MTQKDIYRPQDRPPLGQWIPLSFQHVFAMFGATVLVPIIVGIDPSIALFTAGTGTLIFIICTGAKVPAFLGSSFAFIAPLIAISTSVSYGGGGGINPPVFAYAMGGAMVAGLFYCLVGLIIRFTGKGWLDRALPPVVIGSVIIVIGLYLAPTAMNMAMMKEVTQPAETKVILLDKTKVDVILQDETKVEVILPSETKVDVILPDETRANIILPDESRNKMLPAETKTTEYSLVYLSIAVVTLLITVIANIFMRGFFSVIPILIGLAFGYLFTLIMGFFFPVYALIDFQAVKEADWFARPHLQTPKFALVPIMTFVIVSLATICEHLGDMLVTGKIVGQDFYKNPGLHRTLPGDGLATTWAALWGGPPSTTYSENVGVMAITRVYSVWVIGGAAVIAILLSVVYKFSVLIQTIPTPVLGGISMLLFGIIASSGLRTLVESGVDYKDKRNLTISSVILVIGVGGGMLKFNIGAFPFELANIALATVVGIILNLAIPANKTAAKE